MECLTFELKIEMKSPGRSHRMDKILRGLYAIPGVVDAHVFGRAPGRTYRSACETVVGTAVVMSDQAFAKGLVTTVRQELTKMSVIDVRATLRTQGEVVSTWALEDDVPNVE
jgi:dihydroorotase-like cyclic amidohydrolase